MLKAMSLCVLFLVGCTSTHVVPPCGMGEDCAVEALVLKTKTARHTVQTMLLAPTLINGIPAEPNEWPASVYATNNGAACSATLVGERVLFMASHCMPDGGDVSFTAHANNYTARCTHHPEYRKNPTADWAYCLVDRPVIGIAFENLGISAKLKVGDTVMLTGYGCIHQAGGGGNDGIFRVGQATVQGLPYRSTYDVVTKGGAAVCFGDSGGSAYIAKASGERVIFGVNSRGDIDTMSYLPAVSSPTFISWSKSWARAANNVKICGIHLDASSCRAAGVVTDGKFDIATKKGCVRGVIAPGFLSQKNEIVSKISAALQP